MRLAPVTPTKTPLTALLALATTVFLGCLAEVAPAGILLDMSAGLGASPSATGQVVTVYAVTTAATAVPLTALTTRLPRKQFLLALVAGFVLTNFAIALSPWFSLVLAARVVSGAITGVMWSLVAGYAMRLVPAGQSGRALAIAMAGTPVGFALGVPAGAALGEVAGWRWVFVVMGLIALGLIGWILVAVPPFPGARREHRTTLRSTFATPRLRPMLLVVLAFSLGHNLLYTYVGPVFALRSFPSLLGAGLLVFGVATVAGLFLVGTAVDRHPVAVLRLCAAGAAAGIVLLAGCGASGVLAMVAMGVWGLAFGGAPTAFQAVTARLAGPTADTAQALTVATWNGAVALGAAGGGILLTSAPAALPWSAAALVALPLAVLAARPST